MKISFTLLFLLSFIFNLYPLNLHSAEYIIKNKGILDTTSGKIISGNYIYVDGDKISKISPIFDNRKKLIDLSHLYILPGLIDAHSHLFFTQTLEDKSFTNALVREANLAKSIRINRAKSFLAQYLQEGFTTIFDLGNSGQFYDVELKNQIRDNPNFPELFISGPGLAINKAQFLPETSLRVVSSEYAIINNQTNVNVLLEKYLAKKIDILKIYLDNTPNDEIISREILRNILTNPLVKKFKKITFHTMNPKASFLIKEFNLSNLEHLSFSDLKDLGPLKYVTLTDIHRESLLIFNSYSPVGYLSQLNRANQLFKKNASLIFGPDFYFHQGDFSFNRAKHVKKSIYALREAGLSSLCIIKSMTVFPAQSIREDHIRGQIKPGYVADLIAVSGNPIEDISTLEKILFVMNRGQVIHSF